MKNRIKMLLLVSASSLTLCLGTISCTNGKGTDERTSADASTKPTTQAQTQPDFEKQRQDAEQQARPSVEKERKQVEEEAGRSLDQDAKAAIDETQKAIDAIASDRTDLAMQAIERATGKINVLLARDPATGLIPVSVRVEVIDTAPSDTKTIKDLVRQVSTAIAAKDYPAARVVLDALTSEIRVRTYSLPLGTYLDALKEAARLVDQKKNQDASNVLLAALNTLLAVDRVTLIGGRRKRALLRCIDSRADCAH
jgi:hypothetical protein